MIIEGLHEKDIYTETYPFRIELNTFDNFDWPLHWHHAAELVYPVENDYRATVNGLEYTMCEKDILFIAGGDIHSFHTRNNKGNRFFIQFEISTLDVFGQSHQLTPFLSMTKFISAKEDPLLHTELEKNIIALINEYQHRALGYTLYLNARIFDILVLLSRSVCNNISAEISSSSNKKFHILEKLNLAFQYIEEQYQNDISLKDVSSAAGFSEYHFSRIFKEMTGNHFLSYLNERRIKQAIRLLIAHNKSITEIALSSGFNSIATFNRTFKKLKGCTPVEYKKMQF
ncbi:helix-turn-helix transcriptional regulator [Pelosinus fermentans]|uniref:Transcriptional regulator with only HTH domain, AraC family n=1 Tax=Pelosinus fermentans JBW45 TaxID=1192197 RepID=I8TQ92_9FIRM|nr:AraC family transcriptional regulator [Pelosinus fermentans]AJQ28748.1 transcriptional regulator with only HTH domain, AraC family [Pelosinus fermentans JBW45]